VWTYSHGNAPKENIMSDQKVTNQQALAGRHGGSKYRVFHNGKGAFHATTTPDQNPVEDMGFTYVATVEANDRKEAVSLANKLVQIIQDACK